MIGGEGDGAGTSCEGGDVEIALNGEGEISGA